ncbi:vicilin-like seed storage protein At4g36700 [Bidens hawaiensis]|uniref:vicilin-like seed storage protein At4g36700 n=1 Tax=Bidens hawaiensis TaxID=980011 RepID=UPI00404AB8DB
MSSPIYPLHAPTYIPLVQYQMTRYTKLPIFITTLYPCIHFKQVKSHTTKMKMKANVFSLCLLLFVTCNFIYFPHATTALSGAGAGAGAGVGAGIAEGPVPVSDGPTVKKDERWPLVSTEFGEVSAVNIRDGSNGSYYLHFITLNPRALFLPVYLHSEMVFYVDSGNGTLSWMNAEKDKVQQVLLHRGDIFRLTSETIFYIENNVQSGGYRFQNLQIYAIFPGSEVDLQIEPQVAGVYTPVHDLVLGFDDQVLQSTLSVPLEVIQELRGAERQPLIVEGQPEANSTDVGLWGIRGLFGRSKQVDIDNKMKAYNIFREDHDVETCFGWSATVTQDVLKHTYFGVFMVNLTKGSLMGPHWDPNTVQIAIVLQGQGMIQVICPGIAGESECKNSRLKVEEGDVFVVPKSHPMAQMSFNNDSFVFVGFKLGTKKENAQYLTGKNSILQRLDRSVLQKSFNVKNTTLDWLLSARTDNIISECVSCAEEEAAKEQEEAGGGGGGVPPEEGGGSEFPPQEEGGGSEVPPQEGGGSKMPQWAPQEEGGGSIMPPWAPQEERGGSIMPPWGPQEEGGGSRMPPLEEAGGGWGSMGGGVMEEGGGYVRVH